MKYGSKRETEKHMKVWFARNASRFGSGKLQFVALVVSMVLVELPML